MGIKKNLLYNILLTVSNMIFPIISFPYAARVLGPAGTGQVIFVQSFCSYFIILAALGIPLYGIREIAKKGEDIAGRSVLFFEITIIRIIASVLALVPYFIVVFTVDSFRQYLPLYLWGGFYIIISITSFEWFFSGLEKFKYITSRSLLVKFISIIALFIFVKVKTDVLPYFLINVFVVLLNGIFNIKYSLNFLHYRNIPWKKLNFRPHMRPLFLILGGMISIQIYTILDSVILGLLTTNKAVGLYNAASRITKISIAIITSLGTVLVPKLSYEFSAGNKDAIDKLLQKSFDFVYTLGIPMMIGIYVLAPELVQLFAGKQFYESIITIRILSPVILIVGLANIFAVQILNPLSKDNLTMKSAVLGAILSLILNLCLVPIFKENGSAISNLAVELTVTCFLLYFAKKQISFSLSSKSFYLNLLGATPYFVFAYIARKLLSNDISILLSTFTASSLLFLSVQYFIIKNPMVLNLLYKLNFNKR